jgi:hypothetical protein
MVFFQPNSTDIIMTETRLDNSNLKNNLAIFKLGSKFKPNTNYQFDYDVSSENQLKQRIMI